MSAMAYISITPLGESESVSQYVSKAVKVVKESGVNWQLTPMGTVLEADTPMELFEVINKAIEALEECNRISISVKMDYRKNRTDGMQKKVDAVMSKI